MGNVILRLVVAAIATWPVSALAQLYVPAQGQGSFSTTFQVVTDHDHLTYQGDRAGPAHITTNSVVLKLDYGLTDRLAVNVTVPYIQKRYIGRGPHDPHLFDDDGHDHEHEQIDHLDDGHFHGHWQDWGVGVRYRWLEAPLAVTPFLNYSRPSHDYTFFAHAAPGTRQERTQLGVFVGRPFGPPWINTYVQASYSYTFVEKVLDISINYSTLNLELGYHFNPRLSARVFASYRKTHGGLDFPIDFPPPRNNELFLNHDRIQRIDYLNGGVGLGYQLNDRYALTLDYLATLWGENGHEIHNAVALTVYRGF